jgi:hypothetical protein
MTQISRPSRSKAAVNVPITSASPPVLASGVTSEAIMAIFMRLSRRLIALSSHPAYRMVQAEIQRT